MGLVDKGGGGYYRERILHAIKTMKNVAIWVFIKLFICIVLGIFS